MSLLVASHHSYVPVKGAEECPSHLLGHLVTLGGALVSLRYRLLTKDILASFERAHDVLLVGECRRAYDGGVDFAILVDLGDVVRVYEGGDVVTEVPLCPAALPDAGVGFHDVGQLDPRVRYDVGQVDRAGPAHAEEGHPHRRRFGPGRGQSLVAASGRLVVQIPVKCGKILSPVKFAHFTSYKTFTGEPISTVSPVTNGENELKIRYLWCVHR